MGLFKVSGDRDADPGTRFFIGKDEESGKPCYVWLRRLPSDVIEKLDRQVPGKMKKPKFGGPLVRIRTEAEEAELVRLKHAWALLKIEGPVVTPLDDDAVMLFSAALGKPVKKGVSLDLNGDLNEKTKLLLFKEVPALGIQVGLKLAELNHLFDEEEEAEARNLSTGSSGESPRSSQE